VTISTIKRRKKKKEENFLMNTRKEGLLYRDRQNNDFTLSAVGRRDTSRESKYEESRAYTTILWIKLNLIEKTP
jgi:hypothetical protein